MGYKCVRGGWSEVSGMRTMKSYKPHRYASVRATPPEPERAPSTLYRILYDAECRRHTEPVLPVRHKSTVS